MNSLAKRILFNKTVYACGFILAILLIAYGNSFHNDFLLDDRTHLLETGEEFIGETSFLDLITKDLNGFYRPSAFFIYKIASFLFGENVFAHRIYSFLLYYLICILFYFILNDFIKDRRISFLSCCLFAVHPINQGLINFVSMSNNSLYVLYMQISTLFFLRYINNDRKKYYYYLSLTFYILSLFAHEISFLLPFFLFLICYYFKDLSLKRLFKISLPYAFLFVFYFFVRIQIPLTRFPSQFFQLGLSFHQYFMTSLNLIFWYFSKLFLPFDIIFIWDEPIVYSPNLAVTLLLLVGFLIIFIIIVLKGRKNNIVSFGFVLFAAGLMPVFLASYTYTFFSKTAIIEPHWFTFPVMGFFLILSCFLISFKKIFSIKVLSVFLFLLLSILVYFTNQASSVWKDHETYCRYWIGKNFLNNTPQGYLAQIYITRWDKGLVQENYQFCQEISRLAASYHILGYPQKTIDYYNLSIEKDPYCAMAYYGKGLHFLDLGFCDLASASFLKATKIDSRYAVLYKMIRSSVRCPLEREDFFTFAEIRHSSFNDIFQK